MHNITFQISLDQPDLGQAVALAEIAAAAVVQVLEAGTGLILSEGARHVLPRLRSAFPQHGLVADIKCTDGAAFEVGQMFDLGATAATVMASASDATIQAAVMASETRPGCMVMVDTMGAGGPDGLNTQGHALGTWEPITRSFTSDSTSAAPTAEWSTTISSSNGPKRSRRPNSASGSR